MVIGVIGGVGAGKSSVLDVLTQEYQFTAYRTDNIAKSFYVHGDPVFEALKALLGADIERADGSVDLPVFASRIYGAGKQKLRSQVDSIVPSSLEIRRCAGARGAEERGGHRRRNGTSDCSFRGALR